MANHVIDKADSVLAGAQNVLVVLRERPNLDNMAAGLSLYLSFTKAGKKTQIICPTPPTVEFGNLVGINKVRQNHQGAGGDGLIISLPYQQGSIEKISYDIVGDRINLTVVPGAQGLNFTTEDISYQSPGNNEGAADVVITVGVPSEDELYRIYKADTAGQIINIDTSMQNTGFGTVTFVNEGFSSSCEIVTDLLTALNYPLDIDIAQNLLSGIVEETENFQSPKTSAFAFELAALLMKQGARRVDGRATMSPPVTNAMPQRRVSRPAPMVQDDFAQDLPLSTVPTYQPQDKYRGHQAQNQQPKQQNKFDQKTQAPKDWFEPRIYKGSTPVS